MTPDRMYTLTHPHRMLKSRVAMQYPAAYGEVQAELQSELEEEEEEERLGEDQDR